MTFRPPDVLPVLRAVVSGRPVTRCPNGGAPTDIINSDITVASPGVVPCVISWVRTPGSIPVAVLTGVVLSPDLLFPLGVVATPGEGGAAGAGAAMASASGGTATARGMVDEFMARYVRGELYNSVSPLLYEQNFFLSHFYVGIVNVFYLLATLGPELVNIWTTWSD